MTCAGRGNLVTHCPLRERVAEPGPRTSRSAADVRGGWPHSSGRIPRCRASLPAPIPPRDKGSPPSFRTPRRTLHRQPLRQPRRPRLRTGPSHAFPVGRWELRPDSLRLCWLPSGGSRVERLHRGRLSRRPAVNAPAPALEQPSAPHAQSGQAAPPGPQTELPVTPVPAAPAGLSARAARHVAQIAADTNPAAQAESLENFATDVRTEVVRRAEAGDADGLSRLTGLHERLLKLGVARQVARTPQDQPPHSRYPNRGAIEGCWERGRHRKRAVPARGR